jgi:hypothetical protein
MREENHEDWDEAEDQNHKDLSQEIQKLLTELEVKAKKAMNYLVLEGFVERTDDPNVFKYTPEGLVLAQQQHKKMLEDGLL